MTPFLVYLSDTQARKRHINIIRRCPSTVSCTVPSGHLVVKVPIFSGVEKLTRSSLKGFFNRALFAYKNERFASSFLLLGVGLLQASKKANLSFKSPSPKPHLNRTGSVFALPTFGGFPVENPTKKANRLKALLRGISLSEYGLEGSRVRLTGLSEYGSVAYLVERPTRETQAEQYSDTGLHKLFCPVGLGTTLGLSGEFTGFVPGTNPVKTWDKPGFSPYFTQWKPDFTGFVPGTNPQSRGRRAAQKVYVKKVYVPFSLARYPARVLRAMEFLVSQHGQLGAPFSLGEHAKWRCDTPPQKGYLSDTCAIPYENKAKRVRYPPLRYYLDIARYGGVSRIGPLRPFLDILICFPFFFLLSPRKNRHLNPPDRHLRHLVNLCKKAWEISGPLSLSGPPKNSKFSEVWLATTVVVSTWQKYCKAFFWR